jgi:hypothetical protein
LVSKSLSASSRTRNRLRPGPARSDFRFWTDGRNMDVRKMCVSFFLDVVGFFLCANHTFWKNYPFFPGIQRDDTYQCTEKNCIQRGSCIGMI